MKLNKNTGKQQKWQKGRRNNRRAKMWKQRKNHINNQLELRANDKRSLSPPFSTCSDVTMSFSFHWNSSLDPRAYDNFQQSTKSGTMYLFYFYFIAVVFSFFLPAPHLRSFPIPSGLSISLTLLFVGILLFDVFLPLFCHSNAILCVWPFHKGENTQSLSFCSRKQKQKKSHTHSQHINLPFFL